MNLKFESVGKIKDYPPSDIVGKFIIFKNELEETITHMVDKICYIDPELILGYVFPLTEKGLHIAKVATATLDDENNIKMDSFKENVEYKLLPQEGKDFTLKLKDVKNCEFIFTDKASKEFKNKSNNALPFIKDVTMEKLCQNKQLDPFRDQNNPLIVNVDGINVQLENSGSYGFVGKFLEKNKRVKLKLKKNNLIIDEDFMNSNYNQEILYIKSKLTDNSLYNKRFLKNKFEDFKDNKKVRDVIFKKYLKELKNFDKEIFNSRISKFNNEIYTKTTDFIEMSKMGENKKALNLIEKYISNYSCNNGYIYEFFEKDIFKKYFDEKLCIARDDLSMIYKAYGVILNDNHLKEDALKAFKKAYYLNPVNVDNLVEISFYYLDCNLDKAKQTIDLGFKYSYTLENLHELYLCLEQYYYQINDFEKSKIVEDVLSGEFDNASKYNIPTDFNKEIIKLAIDKLEFHIYQDNLESAQYYLNILMKMENCQIEEISEDFKEFQEKEYIDF